MVLVCAVAVQLNTPSVTPPCARCSCGLRPDRLCHRPPRLLLSAPTAAVRSMASPSCVPPPIIVVSPLAALRIRYFFASISVLAVSLAGAGDTGIDGTGRDDEREAAWEKLSGHPKRSWPNRCLSVSATIPGDFPGISAPSCKGSDKPTSRAMNEGGPGWVRSSGPLRGWAASKKCPAASESAPDPPSPNCRLPPAAAAPHPPPPAPRTRPAGRRGPPSRRCGQLCAGVPSVRASCSQPAAHALPAPGALQAAARHRGCQHAAGRGGLHGLHRSPLAKHG